MKLLEDDEIMEESPAVEITYKYITPILNLYRDLTRDHPDQHHHLDPFAADIVKAILQFLVRYRDLDGKLAHEFEQKYLGTLYGVAEERFVHIIGEEKFNEMEKELFALVERKK